ncbi:hypothetical protein [Colwellia psychrerythraea]|uniref:Uncharacterized protein n=1 Tax=Colwellia psychrerythraea TaxID=28229 RepID=A0A099KHQ6_COLPS|nr:hypothetical protein [Colwellia psychrerythraea]KGJ89527.1 hypothetical protein GAB14E_0720 [Colwellia psychrerythraea]
MFTKVTPKADSQLSNEDVANLIVSDALAKISQLTGLNQQRAFALLASQVNQYSDDVSHQQITKIEAPLLEQNEFQFISNLFNSAK